MSLDIEKWVWHYYAAQDARKTKVQVTAYLDLDETLIHASLSNIPKKSRFTSCYLKKYPAYTTTEWHPRYTAMPMCTIWYDDNAFSQIAQLIKNRHKIVVVTNGTYDYEFMSGLFADNLKAFGVRYTLPEKNFYNRKQTRGKKAIFIDRLIAGEPQAKQLSGVYESATLRMLFDDLEENRPENCQFQMADNNKPLEIVFSFECCWHELMFAIVKRKSIKHLEAYVQCGGIDGASLTNINGNENGDSAFALAFTLGDFDFACTLIESANLRDRRLYIACVLGVLNQETQQELEAFISRDPSIQVNIDKMRSQQQLDHDNNQTTLELTPDKCVENARKILSHADKAENFFLAWVYLQNALALNPSHQPAALLIGQMFAYGLGVEQDLIIAKAWFNKHNSAEFLVELNVLDYACGDSNLEVLNVIRLLREILPVANTPFSSYFNDHKNQALLKKHSDIVLDYLIHMELHNPTVRRALANEYSKLRSVLPAIDSCCWVFSPTREHCLVYAMSMLPEPSSRTYGSLKSKATSTLSSKQYFNCIARHTYRKLNPADLAQSHINKAVALRIRDEEIFWRNKLDVSIVSSITTNAETLDEQEVRGYLRKCRPHRQQGAPRALAI